MSALTSTLMRSSHSLPTLLRSLLSPLSDASSSPLEKVEMRRPEW